MSRQIIIKGTFKNGKTRSVRVYNSYGCESEESKLNKKDMTDLLIALEEGVDKSFQSQLENNKFKKVQVFVKYSYTNTNIKEYFGYYPQLTEWVDDLPTDEKIRWSTVEKYVNIINEY